MKKSWIILLGLILSNCFVSLVFAEETIVFNFPSSVNYGESFNVDLTLNNFTTEIYDIKIDIINNYGDRIGEIYDGNSWQSTNYFVNEIIDTSSSNSSSFSLNITERYEGIANLTVKVREDVDSASEIYGVYQTDVLIPEDEGDDDEIYMELEYDEDDIINGEDFKIEVNVFNLKGGFYNFKLWIEDEDEENIISDRYGEDSDEEDVWKSGSYWIYGLFEGPGDKTKKIELRIRDNYDDYHGDAKLFYRLEGESEESEYIEVLEKETNTNDDDSDNANEEDSMRDAVMQQINNSNSITGEVINLGSSNLVENSDDETEDLKEQDNMIYQSKTELIKKYAIYGFALLCVALIILLSFNKLK